MQEHAGSRSVLAASDTELREASVRARAVLFVYSLFFNVKTGVGARLRLQVLQHNAVLMSKLDALQQLSRHLERENGALRAENRVGLEDLAALRSQLRASPPPPAPPCVAVALAPNAEALRPPGSAGRSFDVRGLEGMYERVYGKRRGAGSKY